MKTRMYVTIMLALAIAIVTAGIGTRPVSAQPQSCTAQLNYPVMPTAYANSNVPIVVPLSVTCSTYYGNELYATGNLYDATSGISLGSVNVVLLSVGGGTVFDGQLGFTLPPSSQGDTAQVTAYIYSSQYGNVITTTSITFPVSGPVQPVQEVTTTVTENTNMYPYPYAYQYPPSTVQPSPQLHRHRLNQTQYLVQSSNNTSILVYVAIAAILAAVIIATAGLVVYGRRQPYWAPMPPPLPR
jgi:hypothetical protein